MGWMHMDHMDHEGCVVALVRREGTTGDLFRELSYPDDGEREDVLRIQAACECGWRSPYLVPARDVARVTCVDGTVREFRLPCYSPHAACVTDADEERCRRLWRRHIGVD